jgi:hypothetical protein
MSFLREFGGDFQLFMKPGQVQLSETATHSSKEQHSSSYHEVSQKHLIFTLKKTINLIELWQAIKEHPYALLLGVPPTGYGNRNVGKCNPLL